MTAPQDFALVIYRYGMLPTRFVTPVAMILPCIELVAAVAVLAVPKYRIAGLGVVTGLLVVFLAAMLTSLVRGNRILCGCFSIAASGDHLSVMSIGRDIVLLLMCTICLAVSIRAESGVIPCDLHR
jgi:putative oxidoreductase